jgi:hypothetical protein
LQIVTTNAITGEVLIAAARRAREHVVLCAPFVKVTSLQNVLDTVPKGVAIELFTRWRPDEVAMGVSDVAVLPIVEGRGGTVHLCDRVHAKLFRFDDIALIGSANLTAAALGWSATSNLELLVEVPASTPEVIALEISLQRNAIPATAEIAKAVEQAAALLPAVTQPSAEIVDPQAHRSRSWRPLLREPRDLSVAYSRGLGLLSGTSAAAASADLAALEIPPGFGVEAFEAVVGTRLMQEPLVQMVDDALVEPQRFGAIRDLLGDLLDLDRAEASHAWQTLMRWLLYFLPSRYSRAVPSHSEIMVKQSQLPS